MSVSEQISFLLTAGLDEAAGQFVGCPNCGRLPKRSVHPLTRRFRSWVWDGCVSLDRQRFLCEPAVPLSGEELLVLQYRFWEAKKAGDPVAGDVLRVLNEVNRFRTRDQVTNT